MDYKHLPVRSFSFSRGADSPLIPHTNLPFFLDIRDPKKSPTPYYSPMDPHYRPIGPINPESDNPGWVPHSDTNSVKKRTYKPQQTAELDDATEKLLPKIAWDI